MAPDIDQMHVVNHLTGDVAEGESRNVLVESARIARGNIVDIQSVTVDDYDALILPGGFGAAKNLCDFAVKGPDCSVNSDIARLLKATVQAKKPLGAVCIAPAVLAKVLGSDLAPSLTIGTDTGTADAMQAMGATHIACPVKEVVIDREHKIVTSPAYMLAGRISEAADGIEETVRILLSMID
jgi:enhancing lycopene biosynthesis protein 2